MSKDYIERGMAIAAITGWETDPTDEELEWTLNNVPAADVVEVTRCKDCEHAGYINNTLYCYYWGRNADEDDYCSEGYCVDGGADNG